MPKFLNISDLRSHKLKKGYYFLDANVWIFALNDFDGLKDSEKKYVEFFYEIFDDNTTDAIVLVNSLLISEIFNTYMRVIGVNDLRLKEYNGKLPEKFDMKRNFRNAHPDLFNTHREIIKDNLSAFLKKDNTILIDDTFYQLHKDLNVIGSCPAHFDFNDHYYYLLMKGQPNKPAIVTNDSDWIIEDLDILTTSRSLLDKRQFL